MKSPVGGWWPAVAAVAVVVALVAGPIHWLTALGATLAVVAATLAIVTELSRRVSTRGRAPPPEHVEANDVRAAFRAGGPGRVDLVLACDLLERKITRPELRAETPVELASVTRMDPEEFRRYLDRRLQALEAAT